MIVSSAQSSVGVSKVPEELLKAVEAVGLPIPGVCLVLPLLEGTPAVGADKTPWMKLVAHGCDDSSVDHLGADTALVLGWWVI